MNSDPCEIRTDHEGAAATLHLTGRIDRDADAAFAEAYATVRELGARTIELDFESVGYINSTGIALIVRLLADARRDGREVRAGGLSDHYREIFRITRLSDFMTIEDAIPAVASGGING
jgi:anti-sigma B factor antagonist